LQPVAISCNKNFYHDRFASPVDARAHFENASAASNMLRRPILCKKTNVVELAFSEVHAVGGNAASIGFRAGHHDFGEVGLRSF
jgi:hypothetical protein